MAAALLLLQFLIGAVYAWSVFSKALQASSAFHLSQVEAALPFEVTIGMVFVGTYVGGRTQDRKAPHRRVGGWRPEEPGSTPVVWGPEFQPNLAPGDGTTACCGLGLLRAC